ncbi:MAG: hypothetical protein E6K49_00755 [Gammaproteobacteria bacterium]|nr:MAG: hypothetical protein E6K49_00755 [Gammaproteobacteria bacterium]
MKGARIGITRAGLNGFTNVTTPAPVTAAIEAAFKALSDAGATVIDLDAAGFTFTPAAGEFGVLLYDFKNDLAAYFATRLGVPVAGGTLQTAIDFNKAHADVEMPFFNQDIFDLANSLNTADPNAPQDPGLFGSNSAGMASYNIALDLDQAAGVSMDQALSMFNLDAVVSATDNPAWATDLVYGDHFIFGTSGLAAGPGYPILQVPAGEVFGVPLGISFFGTAFSEPKLIKLASGYEAATHARAHNLPTFAATVPFDHIKGPLQQAAAGDNQMQSAASAVSSNTIQGAAAAQAAAAAAPNQAASAKVRKVPHHL